MLQQIFCPSISDGFALLAKTGNHIGIPLAL